MAQYGGGNPNNPPWARGQPPPGSGHGMEMPPGLLGFGGHPQQGGAPGGPPQNVFHQSLLGGPPNVNNPAVTLGAMVQAGQQGVSYPRPMGSPFAAAPPANPAQQILQQQQAAAAVVGVSLHHHQQQQQHHNQQHGPPGPGQPTQRVFTGTVTKLHDNFGFVDEDVFFQTTVVKGQNPRVNDRVLVEAGYNPNMPFKWNATRIQVLPNQRAGMPPPPMSQAGHVNPTATPNNIAFSNPNQQQHQQGNNSMQQSHNKHSNTVSKHQGQQQQQHNFGRDNSNSRDHRNGGGSDNMGSSRSSNMNRQNNSPMRGVTGGGGSVSSGRKSDDRSHDRSRRDDSSKAAPSRASRDRDRSRDKERAPASSTSTTTRKRSRSPVRRTTKSRSRSRSPPRRRARTAPRYHVSVPKLSLDFPESNVMLLKKRYNNIYVPSDFFLANHAFQKSFPIHDPYKINYPSSFHVFNKEHVERPVQLDNAELDPPDADYTFCVKVMLIASPSIEELYEKTCHLPQNGATRESLIHPTRAIQFLVGLRGKNETMAIGGPWSPSLDGPNPESDPSVLVKTAIRTCKALAGIDLSGCTQWHKFLEINYRRQETSTKPARTETTVIFLPDVWSVMPTREEFTKLEATYAEALHNKLNPEPPKPKEKTPEKVEEEKEGEEVEKVDEKDVDTENKTNEEEQPEGEEEEDAKEEVKKPTSWSELDIKTMKVDDLREELEARNLNCKGLKSQLVGRLQKAIKQEQEKEEQEKNNKQQDEEEKNEMEIEEEVNKEDKDANKEDDEIMEIVPDEKKTNDDDSDVFTKPKPIIDDKLKQVLNKVYKMPSSPCILVHPNTKAKSGKFDCTTMSLSVLLDYRIDDNKEGTFEVSLFAELFNEMLMRDSGFKIYRALTKAVAENKKEKETKKLSEKDSTKEKDEKPAAEESKEQEEKEETKEASSAATKEDVVVLDEDSNHSTVSKKPDKKKMVTVNKDLLLACSYFDQGHCGYLETKDLEDIFFIMNLSLSRAQIKKLVTKVVSSKDQVNYRVYTDKPEDELEAEKTEEKVVENEAEEDADEELEQLGRGFKAFVPWEAQKKQEESATDALREGLCHFRGSVIDVKQLLAQLERSERARSDTENRLLDTAKNLNDMKESADKYMTSRDKLQVELKEVKKRLRSAEDDFKKSQTDTSKYYSTLKDIYGKISPIVQIKEKPEKKVEPSTDEQEQEQQQQQNTKEQQQKVKEEVTNGESKETEVVKLEEVKPEQEGVVDKK